MTTVSIHMPENTGLTGFTLYLRKTSDGTLVNTDGDALTESPASSGRFTATVAESWTETLAAVVLDGSSLAVRDGWLAVGETIVRDGYPGGLTSKQDATLTAIATAVSGGAIEPTSRVASGGTITAYIGDDFKVRSDTELSLSVSDVGGTLYTKWSAIGEENLYFGASREGADVGAITGTVASITSVGSGASQTCKLTVEITNCGTGLKPGTYDYQIEQRQTQGSDTDSFIEVAGSLILKRNSVA